MKVLSLIIGLITCFFMVLDLILTKPNQTQILKILKTCTYCIYAGALITLFCV